MSNTIYSFDDLSKIAGIDSNDVTELKVRTLINDNPSEFVNIPQLTAPTISLSGDILSWSAVSNASSYLIYADNTLKGTTNNTSFDLSTLQLEKRTYSIQVKSNRNGYINSNLSNSVIYVLFDPYLTFSSPDSFTLNVVDKMKRWGGTLEYSTDTINWSTWSGTTTLSSASDGTKHNLYLRGTGNNYITGSNADNTAGRWELTGSNISCEGNIENLLDYATAALGNHPVMHNRCYAYMFYGCTSLTSAPKLPATTLESYCYYAMFYGCASLTSAPALPATTLATGCYGSMFRSCSSLTTLPKLPATTLESYCYGSMFYGCSKIKLSTTQDFTYKNVYRIPKTGTGSTASSSLDNMFTNTGGTFTGTPSVNTTYYTSNTVI